LLNVWGWLSWGRVDIRQRDVYDAEFICRGYAALYIAPMEGVERERYGSGRRGEKRRYRRGGAGVAVFWGARVLQGQVQR